MPEFGSVLTLLIKSNAPIQTLIDYVNENF